MLSPASSSGQDHAIAAKASTVEVQVRQELAAQKKEGVDTGGKSGGSVGKLNGSRGTIHGSNSKVSSINLMC